MTVRVDITAPRVEAAPGDIVDLPVRLTNTGDTPATCRVVVVGLDDTATTDPALTSTNPASTNAVAAPVYDILVPAGETVEVLSPVVVPWVLGIGDHSAAVEVTSDRPGDRPVLTPFVISIGSVARVDLLALPSTMRGRRRAKFKLDVVNNELVPVDLVLSAEAQDVRVQFRDAAMRLQPGERSLTTAQVKGPRHWSGESTQHNLLITARGRASSTSTTAAYIQRPLFAHRARMMLAALTVIALWLGAIGGVALWWSNRSDDQVTDGAGQIEGVDTNGDGVDDQFTLADGTVVNGIDTDGDGDLDAFFDAAGNPVDDPRSGSGGSGSDGDGSDDSGDETADGSSGEEGTTTQTSALLRGTVTAEGEPDDITITLTPIALGAPQPEPAAVQGFVGPQAQEAAKIWSARVIPPGSATLNPIRQTEPIAPIQDGITVTPKSGGLWQIPNVELRRTYEIVFAKPGYNTQSFVVTPPEDGSALELDVELEPATGAISGTVRGPGGALGGAEIVVSDGVLTFTTTSATVGAVGTWSVGQVSTPGVYTVSATLRGYGTEVRQVTLDAGETFASADLNMEAGVGSISGRVSGPDGQPLGGVSITATNGDESRTTSSLTEGDIGSYNIPQLSVGATFTLLVTAPGYLSESRRTPVNGATAGVDFGMTKTTLTLTGMVTSGTTGVGVANAGLTLTTGDLTFRASTVGGANRGAFAIDDLPPGSYTVTVDHYQHIPSTQQITLTAGVTPPPLEIALESGSGLPALGTGSLVVEVVDPGAKTAEARQIKNATVRLIRTQTGEELPPTTQEAFNFRIDDVPVGTYTIIVTAPRYNPAAPRQVSIGLSEQRVEVQMLRLGQASGYVIDSLTKAKLPGYVINVYRQPESPGDAPLYTLPSDSTGLWQTPLDSLVPGTYRVEITDAASPPGYLVRNDQVLDPAVVGVGAERNMKFVLPEDAGEPITVGSIEADPYPTITGRVYRAAMPPDSVDVVPIDSKDLGVTLACPGGTTVTAAMLDVAGVQGDVPPLLDSWVITKQQIDAANLSGDCTVNATAGSGFAPNPVTLTGVDASNGVTSSDRRLHIVLSPPPPAIGGTVFWLNGSSPVPINNASISSTRATSFSVLEDAAANVPPTLVPNTKTTTSNLDGSWDLDGQIAGVAPYLFTVPDFATGRIDVRVDPAGDATATAVASAALHPTTPDDGQFHVQLSAPTPRTLSGVITIETTGTANFGSKAACVGSTPPTTGVCIIAKSPTGIEITEATTGATTIVRETPVGNTMRFEIQGAEPGSWEVSVTEPVDHDEFGGSIPATDLVLPGSTPVPGFDMSLVENGRLALALVDGKGAAITTAPTIELDGVTFPSTFVPAVTGPSPVPAHFLVTNIPVDPTSPLALPGRLYSMRLTLDGYDTTLSQAVPVNFRAGLTTSVSWTLPKHGSLTVQVNGDLGGGSTEVVNLSAAGQFVVERVDSAGIPIVPPPGEPAFSVTVVGDARVITGPQGYYKITVKNPQYQPQTAGSVPADAILPALPVPPPIAEASVVGTFRIVNDHENKPLPFLLQLIRGNLDLSVYRTITNPLGSPVSTARYQLFKGSTPLLPDPVLIDGGDMVVPNILPDDYRLEIREYALDPLGAPDLTRQIAFPVITNIRIERAVDFAASTTTVVAPLPPLQPTITGKILGLNSDSRAVALPTAGVTYLVSSTYTEPAVIVNGTSTVPNPAQGDRPTATNINTLGAGTGVVTYEFTNVPTGVHSVLLDPTTISALTGFFLDPPNPETLNADVGVVNGPNFEMRVPNVELQLKLTTGDYEGMREISLKSPTGAVVYPRTGSTVAFNDDTDTITFTNVAPELGNFLLSFTDDLHVPFVDSPILVKPDLDGGPAPYVTAVDVPTNRKLARLKGNTTQRNAPNGSGATTGFGPGATITVTGTSDGADCSTPVAPLCIRTVGPGATMSNYSFDLREGDYTITTTLAGYYQTTPDMLVPGVSNSVSIEAGKVQNQNIEITKLATYIVTVKSPDGSDSDDLPDAAPSGTTVEVFDNATSTWTDVGASVGDVFTYNVVPGGSYRLRVRATGYIDVVLPSASTFDRPVIGQQMTKPVTLFPRTISVTVNGGTPPPETKVTARFPDGSFTDLTTPFSFSSAVTTALSTSAAGILLVEAPGYRTVRATIPAPTVGAPAQLLPPVTILPLVELTGTINAPVGSGQVRATSDGVTRVADIVDDGDSNPATNSYTFSGVNRLDVGPEGADRVWTISYDVFRVGLNTTPVTVTVTSSSSTTPSAPITVVPQSISVTFTVQSLLPNGAVDITFNGAAVTPSVTPITASVGVTTAAVTMLETQTSAPFTVSGDGYLVHIGGAITPSSRAPINQPIIVIKREPIIGTVVNGATPAVGVSGAAVRVCPLPPPPSTPPGPPPTICATGLASGTSSGSTGGFTIATKVAPGSYNLWATSTTGNGGNTVTVTGFVPITINDNLTYSLPDSSITVS